MNVPSIIILTVICVLFIIAIVYSIKNKSKGCCNCDGCNTCCKKDCKKYTDKKR